MTRSSAELETQAEAVAGPGDGSVFQSAAAPGFAAPIRLAAAAPTARKNASAATRSRSARGVLALSLLATIAVAAVILVGLDGWRYYRTPLGIRGYTPQHRLLQPAGRVGLALGITGTALMALMQAYSLRKRVKALGRLGSLPRWLDFHIFCGILGPVLITFHTSFKFNGIVSVAYWSMVLVFLSGFVGRYLYVRIPKSIRGQELTVAQVEQRAVDLKAEMLATPLPGHLLQEIEAFEARVLPRPGREASLSRLPFGEAYIRLAVRALRRRVRHEGIGAKTLHDVIALTAERAVLLRRLAYLKRTKKLFDLWHIFHRPLAYVMLVVVIVHVATAIFFGYAFGR